MQATLLTRDQYLALEYTSDAHYELVDGELLQMPPESTENSDISMFLLLQFAAVIPFTRLCRKDAEIEIHSNKAKFREPDLMVLSEAGAATLSGKRRKTIALDMPSPLLAVEVVSPGEDNELRDYSDKRREYASRGIPEYWIIDPAASEIRLLMLADGCYELKAVCRGGDRIESSIEEISEVELNAGQILNAGK